VEACQKATPTANCAAADDFFDTALALDLKGGQSGGKEAASIDTSQQPAVLGCPPTFGEPELSVPSSPDFDFGGLDLSRRQYCRLWPEERQSIGRSIPIMATSFGPHWLGQEVRSEASSGAPRQTGSELRRYRESFQCALHLVPSGQQITWGSWSALDVANGNILWQTADPPQGPLIPAP